MFSEFSEKNRQNSMFLPDIICKETATYFQYILYIVIIVVFLSWSVMW